jgi:predicted O-linked N-acetylglucosamine transferase (SPINDLY family)
MSAAPSLPEPESTLPPQSDGVAALLSALLQWQQQGQLALAVQRGEQALQSGEFDPRIGHVHAVSLGMSGRHAEAAALWERVIAAQPTHVEAMANVGNAYLGLHDLGRARNHLRAALALNPNHPLALYNAATLAVRERDWLWARQCLDTLLAAQPGHVSAWRLLTQVAQMQLDYAEVYAIGERARALGVCDPVLLQRQIATATYVAPVDPQRLFDAIARWSAAQPAVPVMPPAPARVPGARLRIGLVSADLTDHPVGLFVQGLLDSSAAREVDWVGFYNKPAASAATQRLRARCAAWHMVAYMDDATVADWVRTERIDVLVDLSGHTVGNRLGVFARKPAPVQLSWLGYHATTGLAAMDAVLADPVCVPEAQAHWFTETVWRLPHTRMCMQPLAQAPEVAALPALARAHFTFGSFQDLTKISDDTLALWGAIARAVPTAVFRIQSRQLDEHGEALALAQRRLSAAGVALAQCRWAGNMAVQDYLAAYAEVDVVLDSFPFTNGTKTVQALWMGVPTITLAMPGMLGRQGQALMTAAGLAQWVAQTPQDYVAQALHWAQPQQWPALAAWRLQASASLVKTPLFDHEAFGRDWLAVVKRLWQQTTGQIVAAPRTPSETSQALQAIAQTQQAGDSARALALAHEAVQRWPDQALTHNMLGWVLDSQGQSEAAAAAWRQAVELQPRLADALSNLGLYYKGQRDWERAQTYLQRAIDAQPQHYNAHFNLGQTYADQGWLDQAQAQFERALAIEPNNPQPRHSLGVVAQRRYDFVQACSHFEAVLQRQPAHLTAWSNLMFALHYRADAQPQAALEAARAWAEGLVPGMPRCAILPASQPDKRLTVGLVSGDLRDHSVTHFLMSLLDSDAAREIDWVAYANNPLFDSVSQRIAHKAKAWHHIQTLSDKQVCALVQADGVDILVDLAGVTAGHRVGVFARKPAPVQVSWLGYFASLGLPTMDAVLADPVCVPEGEGQWFSERVWRLPHTRLCMVPPVQATAVVPTPALTQGHITYGSFQDLAKITDEVLAAWGQIAQAVPTARFRIQARFLDAEPDKRSRFEARLLSAGIALERVSLHTNTPFADYFAAHGEVDVLLDTFPYPGGTTTVQAVWMGVPTVSLSRPGMLARQGAGLLHAAGLADWVASSTEAYVAKAVAWAQPERWPELNALRLGLRERARTSPLFDGQRFGRDWVDVVRALWRQACSAPPPASDKPALQVALEATLAWRSQGHLLNAAQAAWQATDRWPDQALAHNMLGAMLNDQGRADDAARCWQRAIELAPRFAAALDNLGEHERKRRRFGVARSLLERAVAAAPRHTAARLHLGDLLQSMGERDASKAQYEAVLQYEPQHIQALMNLGMWHARGRDFVRAHALYRQLLALEPSHIPAHFNLSFTLHYGYPAASAEVAELARRWGQATVASVPACVPRAARDANKRLRIGVVSADLRDHPVGLFFQGLIDSQAASEVDWVAYSNQAAVTELTHALRARMGLWHETSAWSDARLCEQVQADGVDVLIDMAGCTGGARLGVFARKPAPVQLTWLGYFASTGLPTMDGVLADPVCVPAHEEAWFTERVWRLPHTRMCMAPVQGAPEVSVTPALAAGHFTFGSFQEMPKITDAVLDVWAQVLHRVPQARLRVQSGGLSTPVDQAAFAARLVARGVAPERLQLLGRVSLSDFFSAHSEVDVLLDTFSFPGGTTTVQALWMGVPTITLTQPGMLARQGEQLLRAVGLDAWVCTTVQAYVALAEQWSQPAQWAVLNALRSGLRERARTSPLFDTQRFGRDWVDLVRTVWRNACGESPIALGAPSVRVVSSVWRQGFKQALALRSQGEFVQAAAVIEPLLQEQPHRAELLNLKAVLMEEAQQEEAWALAVQDLLAFAPQDAASMINAARWQQMHAQLGAAREVLRGVLQRDKNNVEVMLTLAPVLRELGDHKGARQMLQRAIKRAPDNAAAYFKLGVLCESMGDFDDALRAYDTALDLAPDHRVAMTNRMMGAFRLPSFDWRTHTSVARQRAQAWERAVPSWPSRRAASEPQRRLRIGVLSADLGAHPVGYFFQSLLCSQAAAQADWVAYSGGVWDDAVNRGLRARCTQWHQTASWTAQTLCQRIGDDGIDVLLDLSGYTAGGRLDAVVRRPAPVQVSWLGYFATTGLTAVDAVIADPVCVPDDELDGFVEPVWRLPHTRLCMPPLHDAPAIAPTPALANGHLTLGCYQDLAKINDGVLQVWAQMARAVPSLRFRVQSSKLGQHTPLRQSFIKKLAAHGIAPARVQLVGSVPMARYLASYSEVDFCLDTWPYTGGTTTVQGLWMGVPTLSLATPGMLGRQGEGVLRAAGLDGWVVHSTQAMVAFVKDWANAQRWPELQALREGLRTRLQVCPLFDTERFASDWMRTVRGVWQHACLSTQGGWTPADLPAVLRLAKDLADHGQWRECATLLTPLVHADETGLSWRQLHAIALSESDQREQATQAWADVLARDPPSATVWANAALFYERSGQADLAMSCFAQVLERQPDHLPALSRVAHAALAQQRYTDAVALYRRWLALQPQSIAAWHNLGMACEYLGDMDAAISAWRSALEIEPDSQPSQLSLGLTLNRQGDVDGAVGVFLHMLQSQPRNQEAHDAMVHTLFTQAYRPERDYRANAQAAARYAEQLVGTGETALTTVPKEPHKVLRVGLVSGDLSDHPVAFFLAPLLRWAQRDQVQWWVYHTRGEQSALTQTLRLRAATWRQVEALDDEALAQRIAQDHIDVLIDLSGFTLGHRLPVFARRVAPVQLSWLGYFASTGLTTMDGVIADAVCVPEAEADGFVEPVLRLPHTRVCFAMPADAPAVSALPAPDSGVFTWGCFQHPGKINPEVRQVWGRIAQALPHARWRFQHKAWREDMARATLAEQLQAAGFAPEQIEWADSTARLDYLRAHARLDAILDTFPYNGGTTTVEALIMGVPTLSRATPGMMGRQGESLLGAAGLADWVVHDTEAYVARALHWAQPAAWPELAALRARLRKQVLLSPLMDGERFAADWTALVRRVWQDACDRTRA